MSVDPRVSRYFDQAAPEFDLLYSDTRRSFARRWVDRTFRNDIGERFMLTLNYLSGQPFRSVLDVGCGSGRYLVAYARMGFRDITGLDVATGMLTLARTNILEAGMAEEAFHLERGDFLTFEPGRTYDCAVVMGVFDYLPNPEAALRRLHALCEHSCVVSFPSRHWFRTPVRRARYRLKRCPVRFFEAAEIRELGRKSGFARSEITKIPGAGQDYFAIFYRAPM